MQGQSRPMVGDLSHLTEFVLINQLVTDEVCCLDIDQTPLAFDGIYLKAGKVPRRSDLF